MEHEFDPTQAH